MKFTPGIVAGGVPAAGGAALITAESNAFSAAFSYETDASRIAVKVAGVVTPYGLDAFYQNGGTSPKIVTGPTGLLEWTPHNLILQSENLQASWTFIGATAPTATFFQTTAANSIHRLTSTGISGAAGNYTYTVDVSAAGYSKLGITAAGSPAGDVAFDLSLGTIIYQNTPTWTASIAPSPLGAGIWRITCVCPISTTGFQLFVLPPSYTTGLVASAWLADGVGGVNVFRNQINRGEVATAYLKTTTATRFGLAIDHHPTLGRTLLMENGITNLCLWSSDLTNVAWVKSNMTAAKTAPDPFGNVNSATTITATAGNATALQAITSASALRITSVFLKRRTGSGNVDLTQDNGTTWATQSITSSWARYAIAEATVLNPVVGIRLATSGDEVDVAFWQCEISAAARYVTSPCLTFAASVTRPGDNYTFLLSTIPSLGAEYSMYVRFAVAMTSNATAPVVLTDGTVNEQAKFVLVSGALRLSVVDGGATLAQIVGAAISANTFMSAAGRFKLNDLAMSTNGAAVGTDTSATLPTVTETRYGGGGTNAAATNIMRLSDLVIVPRGWSDAELMARAAT